MREFIRHFAGYKCAACSKFFGYIMPNDKCRRCGCTTVEIKYEVERVKDAS